jgi:hypothetical protein
LQAEKGLNTVTDSYIRELVQRLRGFYTVPVNDGAGLLNGKSTYTQHYQTTPISREAANAIEWLLGQRRPPICDPEFLCDIGYRWLDHGEMADYRQGDEFLPPGGDWHRRAFYEHPVPEEIRDRYRRPLVWQHTDPENTRRVCFCEGDTPPEGCLFLDLQGSHYTQWPGGPVGPSDVLFKVFRIKQR